LVSQTNNCKKAGIAVNNRAANVNDLALLSVVAKRVTSEMSGSFRVMSQRAFLSGNSRRTKKAAVAKQAVQ